MAQHTVEYALLRNVGEPMPAEPAATEVAADSGVALEQQLRQQPDIPDGATMYIKVRFADNVERFKLLSQVETLPVGTLTVKAVSEPGAGSGTVPVIHLQITQEALQNAGLLLHGPPATAASEASDEPPASPARSYAPSTTDYPTAKEAAERVGWRLTPSKAHSATSDRVVNEFTWVEREDDSVSRTSVEQELIQHLQPPPSVQIIAVERRLIAVLQREYQRKKTKLQAKTDYVAILGLVADIAKHNPRTVLQFVIMLFETKTAAALDKDMDKFRGGAAIESLAVNIQLQADDLLEDEDEGVAVVLTDMNRFLAFMVPRVGDEAIQEFVFSSAGAAYTTLSGVLQRRTSVVQQRFVGSDQPARSVPPTLGQMLPAHLTLPSSEHALAPTSEEPSMERGAHQVDIAECDVVQGIRNVVSDIGLSSQEGNAERTAIYIEDLGHALLRVLRGEDMSHIAPEVMHELPPHLANMYV